MNFPEPRDRRRAAEADKQAEQLDLKESITMAVAQGPRVQALRNRVAALEGALAELMHLILRLESGCQKTTSTVTAEQLLRLLYNWALNVPLIINEDTDR